MRYTSDDREAHVNLWRESGLSRAAYCREAGLSYATFTQWVQRAKKQGYAAQEGPHDTPAGASDGERSAGGFIEVHPRILPDRCRVQAAIRVEILGADVAVLLGERAEKQRVASILEALSRC